MSSTAFNLIEIERLARAALSLPALSFSMANDAWGLLGFRQALVLRKSAGRWGAQAISGLVDAGETTPYQNWLRRVCVHLETANAANPNSANAQADAPDVGALLQLTPDDLPAELAQEWAQWWPAEVIYFFLRNRSSGVSAVYAINGLAFYLFDAPVNQTRLASLSRLSEVWIHAWAMLSGAPGKSWLPGARARWVIALILLAALFIPVRQSVLAPAEIISLESVVLASPLEGVVREVLVRPNQAVTADQPLVALDDTTLR